MERWPTLSRVVAGLLLTLVALAGAPVASLAATAPSPAPVPAALSAAGLAPVRRLPADTRIPAGSCTAPGKREVSCMAIRGRSITGSQLTTLAGRDRLLRSEPSTSQHRIAAPAALGSVPAGGYGPSDLRAMYGVPSTLQPNATIGIVDVGRDPTIASDMSAYRSRFGLPPCTVQSGCFAEYGQNGGSVPVATNGWIGEITLDVEAVSAMCPTCHIVLVDASDDMMSSLYSAVQSLAGLGVHYISMSWGGPETSADSADSQYFDQPGTVYVAATGDNGYNDGSGLCSGQSVCDPAAVPGVVAAGGVRTTESVTSTSTTYYDSAWSGSSSGCAAYTAEPAAQTAALGNICGGGRPVADVSALADPNTGVATYSTVYGWQLFGGTSLATPLITTLFAIAQNTTSPYSLYSNASADPALVRDVTSGSTVGCDGTVLCTAAVGWDGPTGVGVPASPELFASSVATPVTLTAAAGTSATVRTGVPVSGAAFAASGGSGQYAWSATGLPPGVSINRATGAWAGSPTTPGSYSVTIAAADAENLSNRATASFGFTVEPAAIRLATASGAPARVLAVAGAGVDTALATASGATSGLTWSATGLPAGLSIDPSTGVVTGTPTQVGDAPVTVSVTNTAGDMAALRIDFQVVNVYACPQRLTARIRHRVKADCGAYWSPAPNRGGTWRRLPGFVTYSARRLPTGLSIGKSTGLIQGRPAHAGRGRITVTVHLRPNGVLVTRPASASFRTSYTVRR